MTLLHLIWYPELYLLCTVIKKEKKSTAWNVENWLLKINNYPRMMVWDGNDNPDSGLPQGTEWPPG